MQPLAHGSCPPVAHQASSATLSLSHDSTQKEGWHLVHILQVRAQLGITVGEIAPVKGFGFGFLGLGAGHWRRATVLIGAEDKPVFILAGPRLVPVETYSCLVVAVLGVAVRRSHHGRHRRHALHAPHTSLRSCALTSQLLPRGLCGLQPPTPSPHGRRAEKGAERASKARINERILLSCDSMLRVAAERTCIMASMLPITPPICI